MKKTALLGALCLILTTALFSCKKDNVAPAIEKVNSKAFKIDTMLSDASVADDTRTLQNQLYAGDVTLTAGRTYNITGLEVTHKLNLNGATLNLISQWYGFAITMTGKSAGVTNGTIKGQWRSTAYGDPSGYGGIYILADRCSVSHVNISNFSSYGIVVGACNSTSVTYCNISNTGYIGYFYDAESKSTAGGVFSNNTVDRSMLPASTVQQAAVAVRGSTANNAVKTSNWTITNNIIKMPVNPSGMPAECIEVRHCNSAYVANNTAEAGTIGVSMVACKGSVVQNNTISNSKLQGIEFADCNSSKTWDNVVSGSAGEGILIDGGTGSDGIQLNGDKISGT